MPVIGHCQAVLWRETKQVLNFPEKSTKAGVNFEGELTTHEKEKDSHRKES